MPPAYHSRILFLHGFTQTSSIFYAKTSALRKKLIKLGYKCVYLNGPEKLTPAQFPSNDALSKFNSVPVQEDGETNLRGWWVKPSPVEKRISLKESIETIKSYVEDNKVIEDEDFHQEITEDDKKLPIAGIIGFSQGACMAGLLLSTFKEMFGISLKFAVVYSGFMIDTAKGSGNEEYQSLYAASDEKYKVLHVMGEMDTVVSEERVMKLYDHLKDRSTLLKHPGGHFVPNSKIYVEKVTNWILSLDQEEEKDNKKEDDLDDLLDMMDNIGKA